MNKKRIKDIERSVSENGLYEIETELDTENEQIREIEKLVPCEYMYKCADVWDSRLNDQGGKNGEI